MPKPPAPKDPLAWAKTLVTLTDDAIKIPGTRFRFGLDPLIGLIPVAGDTLTLGISLAIVVGLARQGASISLIFRMLGNVLLDYLVGTIPILGDLFDFGFKANRRNLSLSTKYLAQNREKSFKNFILVMLILCLSVLLLLGFAVFIAIQLLRLIFA